MGRNALAVHHVNGHADRETLVPVHKQCHNELHDHSTVGHEVTPEVRAKISATLKGRSIPREVVEKVAESHRGLKYKTRKDKGRKRPERSGANWTGNQWTHNPDRPGYTASPQAKANMVAGQRARRARENSNKG
jgi:hypothetical protein